MKFGKLLAALFLSNLLASCAYVDGTIGERTDTVNRSIADYRNVATLLNILRARDREPFNFVSITGYTGHASASVSLGIPTLTAGPLPVTAFRSYVFGPNTTTDNAQGDFSNGVVDDKASTAALLTPISPSTVALFSRSGYDLLAQTLFVHDVTITDLRRKRKFQLVSDISSSGFDFVFCDQPSCSKPWLGPSKKADPDHFAELFSRCQNDPEHNRCFSPLYVFLAVMADKGLQFQNARDIDTNSVNTGRSRICFDKLYATQSRKEMVFPGIKIADLYDVAAYKQDQYDRIPPSINRSSASCNDPDASWFENSSNVNSSPNIACVGLRCAAKKQEVKPNHLTTYAIYDKDEGLYVEFFFRSPFDIYRFLGSLVRVGVPPFYLQGFRDGSPLLEVDMRLPPSCFAATVFNTQPFCIPDSAYNSKITFELLHDLVNLLTTPSNGNQTSTVRAISGG